MSNETTTTTLDDLTNSALVQAVVIAALTEKPGLIRFCREFNLVGQPAIAAKIATETSFWGSANDDGAGVDSEFDATQATALSNTAYSSGGLTCTPAEYGVAAALTDQVSEDSVDGIDVMTMFQDRMLFVLRLAMEDDYLALLVGLSNSVGSSGVDLSIAQAIAAQTGARIRGAEAEGMVYIFDNQQSLDIETGLIAGSTSAAIYALSADRLIGYMPTANQGMDAQRQIMTLRGFPVFSTGLTDTANTGADVVGACIVPSSAANDASGATTHGMAWKRLPRFETQRQAKGRSTDLVMTCRAGFVELQDGSGTAIITDA